MGEQIRPELVDQASDTVGNDVSVTFSAVTPTGMTESSGYQLPIQREQPATKPAEQVPYASHPQKVQAARDEFRRLGISRWWGGLER